MHIGFVSLAAALLGCSAACAADFTPLPMDLPPSLADDIDAGHYREWQANLPCGADTLKATWRMDDVHLHRCWAASLHVALNEEDMREPGKRDPDKLHVSLILGAVDAGAPVKFELNETRAQVCCSR